MRGVTLNEPDPAEGRPALLASLRRGIERDYVGQVSRDVIRLLRADANPGELVWEAVAHGAPRAEFGWGVDGLLDVVVVDCVAERILRYDPAGEFDFHDDFGWRHTAVAEPVVVDLGTSDVVAAGQALQRQALDDTTPAFIVHAHAVKTSRAASEEAALQGRCVRWKPRTPRLREVLTRVVPAQREEVSSESSSAGGSARTA